MKIKIHLLFGSDLCSMYEKEGLIEIVEEVQTFEFDTEQEADAFLLGVDAATGYLESLSIDEQDYNNALNSLEQKET